MSVAVTRSPHMPHSASSTHSSMDHKNIHIKSEDTLQTTSEPQKSGTKTPPRLVHDSKDHIENAEFNETAQPLAPPPRRAPTNKNTEDQSDYFSTDHTNSNSHLSREPNPFEQSFGNPSTEAPGSKSLLPPVAALTSPAPLGEGASTSGYNWGSSLRAGPLSPAMLGGPVGGAADYFDPSLRGTSFASGVTPNESNVRSGLTPGGGGSMFPAPSPNSQALFQQLAQGGATPSTIDFHRTAMNAAAARKGSQFETNGTGINTEDKGASVAPMEANMQQQIQQPTFGQHDNDAANGLFLLAQASNGSQASAQFAVPQNNDTPNRQGRSHETSPNMGQMRNGSLTGSAHGSGDISDSGDQGKPTTRSRGKRTSGGKTTVASNSRRKAEDAPAKQPSAKKAKNSIAQMNIDMDGMDSEDEQQNIKEEQYHGDGRKMTDEEKRKNFLERNRVAALKCRQRKKQWLANLQAKVELFSSENDTLSAQVSTLREEIVGLKTLLLQHKDCAISQSQGMSGYFQQQPEFSPHANPYGMGMPNGQPVMAGQRR